MWKDFLTDVLRNFEFCEKILADNLALPKIVF